MDISGTKEKCGYPTTKDFKENLYGNIMISLKLDTEEQQKQWNSYNTNIIGPKCKIQSNNTSKMQHQSKDESGSICPLWPNEVLSSTRSAMEININGLHYRLTKMERV